MKKLFFTAIAALALVGCSHNEGWTVKGNLSNPVAGQKLALNGFNAGIGAWYLIDSVNVSENGDFSFTAAQPSPYSDIYSLSYGDKAIFFPIDSAETLTIFADANSFDTSFEVKGTDLAEAMRNVDLAISHALAASGSEGVRSDSLLKRRLTQIAIDDANGVIAYYIISKQVNGKPIFNLNDKTDLRTVGAVANNFRRNRPDDPRTKFLEEIYLANRQKHYRSGVAVEAEEVNLFDIDLYDSKGVSRTLADAASKGKVVLLSFVGYGLETAAPYNVVLHDVYDSNRGNVEVYQVSVGDDEVIWKESAKNVPWTSVYLPATDDSGILSRYNVGILPMTFIINRQGELAERVADPAGLASAVKKYL